MLDETSLKRLSTDKENLRLVVLRAVDTLPFKVRVIEGVRTQDRQNELYEQGRTKPGDIVTNVKGGQSMHNYRCAFDIVPMRGGKPVWGTKGTDGELWQRLGAIGDSCGLEWGGHWKGKLCDMPHFQYTGGLSLNDLMSGKKVQ